MLLVLACHIMKRVKEILTNDKALELFNENHRFIEWFDYDTWCRNDGIKILNSENLIYRNFRNILKNDARFNDYYDLVAVVSLSVSPYPYSDVNDGQIVRRPKYTKPDTGFLKQTGYVGTIVCRDKKTGKILPVPSKWLFTGKRTCIVAGENNNSGLPGLANVIDRDVFCGDYDTYEKLIRINVFERQRKK